MVSAIRAAPLWTAITTETRGCADMTGFVASGRAYEQPLAKELPDIAQYAALTG